jgi:DNA polymerase III delta prime subunit
MKQPDRASTFLRQIRLSLLSVLRLSRGKRLLIVMLSYWLGGVGLWFLLPRVHTGAIMFLPVVSACWLFRYRGILVSLVLNGVTFHLTNFFLLGDIFSNQAFKEKGMLGMGISLGLGLAICKLRTRVDPALAVTISPQTNQPAQIPVRVQAEGPPQSPPTSALQLQNRTRLLQKVRTFWITGVLEQSLHGAALLALGLQEQPDAVANPWRLIIQEAGRASSPLPAGTRITEVYDEAHGELLILGEPGAGKTTLLLELARDLLDRAEQEQTHPIPVVFNLSSWMRKRQSLATWLVEELETKYRVPRMVGSAWINADQVLPLLDGLDEVDAPSRTACMQAINEYHQAHHLVPLVVCCRMNEYLSQESQLALSRAVTIQPLTTGQINEYFARIGERVAALRMVFQDDSILQELATTPLMLTVLIMVYQDSSVEEIKGEGSAEVRKQQIFATYAQRMLRRRSARSRISPRQTIYWLGYLAQQMRQQSQTVFYIERMQPTWLTKKWQRQLYYGLIAGPVCGLFVGLASLGTILSFPLTVLITALIVGPLFGWLSEPEVAKKNSKTWGCIRQSIATSLEKRVVVGGVFGTFIALSSMLYLFVGDFDNWPFGSRIVGALAGGLPIGMCLGVCAGLAVRLERRIEPLEVSSWSWIGIPRDIIRWLLIGVGLIVGLTLALFFMISSHDAWLGYVLAFGLTNTFSLILVVMLVSGVTRGLSKRITAQHIVTPNQGTWRSARYGVIMAIVIGGIAGVFAGAVDFIAYFWLPPLMGIAIKKPLGIDREPVSTMSHLLGFVPSTLQEFWMLHALFWGLVDAAIPALAVGLSCGGAAYVQHFVLRFLLWGGRAVPFNYARFLDYAAERIFLHKVGGGYIFVHRLLLEYFADVEISEIVELVPRKLPLAPLQQPLQAALGEGPVTLADGDRQESDERKDAWLPVSASLPMPQTMLGDTRSGIEELHERLVDQQEASLGQQIGEYRLVRKLGSGGFGTVYLAEQVHEHTQVAMKVLHIPRTSGEELRDFINEARTMRLRHPHILPLLDFGISRDDLPFLIMEYAPQGTVRDRHPKHDRVALSTIISYVDQLASALQYAHDQRIIHRDVKPENMLVRIDGTLMVSDFGVAKLLEQDVVISQRQLGSPAYMAPEQQRGYPCFASDQYALAVVIYEWICGVRPFEGMRLSVVDQHMNSSPPSLLDHLPGHAEAVEHVIFKALAKVPGDRFERIQEFADALREAAQPAISER